MSPPHTGIKPVSSPPGDVRVDVVVQQSLPLGLLGVMLSLVLLAWLANTLWPHALPHGLMSVTLHTAMEFTGIAAALLVFSLAWHARSPGQPRNIVILGCSFLAVALLDFGHAMSFKGMPDFGTPAGTEKAIHFWLAARYTATGALLVAALLPMRPLAQRWSRHALLSASLVWATLVYAVEMLVPQYWPATFIPGQGLTWFKLFAEYGVVAMAAFTAVAFMRLQAGQSQFYNARDLCAAALITILSEISLTLYAHAGDIFMTLGHLYKVVAYFFLYRAVFVTSVRDPYRRLSAEIEERREAEQRAQFLAYHDRLTQLPNRELARDRFTQALADAQRHQTQVAVIFLDLDHFKTINDSMGHACGDLLLQHVADVLVHSVRQSDTVSRQGGDEFLLILKDLPDVDAVGHVVTKLIEEVSKPLIIQGQDMSTSASVGIAMAPSDGLDFDVLMQRADTAMYKAKSEGRNTYRFFNDKMNAESIERLTMRNGMRRALEVGQFVLYYQPQVDLDTGRVFGVEALIRWQHPEWGLVPPGRFIPIAEESGLIVPIGDWVIEEACRQAAAWQQMGFPPITVAVNLSALQFRRGDVEHVVRRALATTGLAPERLELELTESVLISDMESVEARLKGLKALGVKLAIDDFGTGYSSLSYLKRFSVDKLKIDQSFVRDLARFPNEVAIVRAIIQMAGGLGLRTIAEGVETPDLVQALRVLGCQEGQGYWFAKPMPASAFEAWLRKAQDKGAIAMAAEAAETV